MEKTAEHRASARHRKQRAMLGPREKRRLIQLGICMLLFGAVFFAKGADRLPQLRGELTDTLSASANFRAAFADFGWSVANRQPVADILTDLWTDVFLARERPTVPTRHGGPFYESVQNALRQGIAPDFPYLKSSTVSNETQEDPMALSRARQIPPTIPSPSPEPEPEPPAETEPAVIHVEYTGPALPDNATMERYALGLAETVSPVMARLTSGFGWREHPIDGGEKFHQGIDLAASSGTPVLAFAAGTVDYIGESDVYGKYLQLRHAGGVTSFYAHCSKLCVRQGQQVAAGEKVAESGATGHVTGPHLHFELKKDGVRLNPAYYIQTLS